MSPLATLPTMGDCRLNALEYNPVTILERLVVSGYSESSPVQPMLLVCDHWWRRPYDRSYARVEHWRTWVPSEI